MAESFTIEQQMQAAQAGDKRAYERVLRAISAQVLGYIGRKVPPRDRDDVLQEVLSSVHKARHTYDSTRPLMPWVMAIARFRLNDYWRRAYGHGLDKAEDIDALKDVLSADVTTSPDTREDIRKVMQTLPPRSQEVLRLMYGEDKSVEEVAQALGMSASAVKVSAHRSYKVFRKVLMGQSA